MGDNPEPKATEILTRLGRILDAYPDEIYVIDPADLCIVQANGGSGQALGYAADELAGMPATTIMAGHSVQTLGELLRPLLAGDRDVLEVSGTHRRKDGRSYPVEVRFRLSDGDGATLLVAVATDVGQRRAVEERLRRINRAMTTLTRATEVLIHASDTMQLLDEVCRIVVDVGNYRLAWIGTVRHDESKSIVPIARYGTGVGYVDDAVISWSEFDPRGLGPTGTAVRARKPQVARFTATQSSYGPWRDAALHYGFGSSVALPLVVFDQVTGVLNIYASEPDAFDADEMRLLDDLARNVSYGLAALRTELRRRRTERELKESEERYRALVELSPDAILAHADSVVVFANAAAQRVFRVTSGDSLIGRPVLDLVHPDHRQSAQERMMAQTVPTQLVEERLLRLDGEDFYAEVVITELTLHGERTRLVVIRDVTERRQVRDQLVQAAKLATLGEMAAGMAHELSQPLNVIRMAAEGALMLIRRGRASEEYKSKQFDLIADQTRRMAEIIDHIRIFSRKDTGEVETFDAAVAVRMAVELFERQLRGDAVVISTTYPHTPCPVVGRPVQLEQVVMNLLANAADAVREKQRSASDGAFHGKLEVVTTCSEDLGLIWIAVSDNGTGIPAPALTRIFEPFFTTKEIGRGTGLGLSVSFGIIAAMNGRLDACNNKEGASFVITLPLAPSATCITTLEAAAQSGGEMAAGTGGRGKPRHLLVVDDEPEAVEAMAGYLRESGYRVTTAANGLEAWDAFQADPAEVVITDLRMPKGDGRELIGRLRERDPLLPIIVVTGHMGSTERLDDEDDDLAVVMKKPVSLHTLADMVDQFLSD
jgi:PAS domain S-box-containing protein